MPRPVLLALQPLLIPDQKQWGTHCLTMRQSYLQSSAVITVPVVGMVSQDWPRTIFWACLCVFGYPRASLHACDALSTPYMQKSGTQKSRQICSGIHQTRAMHHQLNMLDIQWKNAVTTNLKVIFPRNHIMLHLFSSPDHLNITNITWWTNAGLQEKKGDKLSCYHVWYLWWWSDHVLLEILSETGSRNACLF